MTKALFSIALAFLLAGCGSEQSTVSRSEKFQFVRLGNDYPPILLETSTGCSWALVLDMDQQWEVIDDSVVNDEVPKFDEKKPSVEADSYEDIVEKMGHYLFRPVASGNQKTCQSKFGLGIASSKSSNNGAAK